MNFKTSICFFLLLTAVVVHAQPVVTNETRYLSGTDKDHTVLWDFYCTKGNNSGKWSKIPVPSNWELQGFGTYTYGRQAPKEHSDEEGFYKHHFNIPASWKSKQVYIVFEGSMTDTEVKINGQTAGAVHQGAFYEFRYNITTFIQTGENILEVKVSKRSANESVNRAERYADYWVFGGIYRPVYLEALPEQSIERMVLDAKADGSFKADVYLNPGISDATRLEAQLFTLAGTPVGKPFTSLIQKKEAVQLRSSISKPHVWTAETPHRYKVRMRLYAGSRILHEVSETFGFRTVELRPHDGFYINGTKIRMKGVNRHSFWPSSGRTTSFQLSVGDVNLMKDLNMNAVRMSHYPPDKHFLHVCDSLGLYVLDELAGWQNAYDTETGRKLLKEMVVRDVNHPSIVIWDNGNEGGNNFDLDHDFAIHDPQNRPVIHPWNIFNHMDAQHYKPYDCCTGTFFNGNEVFMPTEFLHGLYDGGGAAGLEDYWNLMLSKPLSAGGFLWALIDEAVVRTDKGNILDGYGNFAPDGIVGPYREKEGSCNAIKEIWSPIVVKLQGYLPPSFNRKILVENRYDFTNLLQCRFTWKLAQFAKPGEDSKAAVHMLQGSVPSPDIAPGLTGYLLLNLPKDISGYDALYLSAYDPTGREIYTWSWPLKTAWELSAPLVNTVSGTTDMATGQEEDNTIIVSANGVTIVIDKQTGLIQKVSNAISPVSLTNGPVLADGNVELKAIKQYQRDHDVVVEAEYTGVLKKLVYTMLANGWLKIEYEYLPSGSFDFSGVSFDYPEDKVKAVKWLGRGPSRVWKNRMRGVEFNVWEKAYNNTRTGESWEYPEFKGYHSNMYWAVIESEEYPFTVVSATDNLFLRLFTPEHPKAAGNNNTNPAFPKGNISFLHAISAIGTKFLQASQLGPQGSQNINKYSNGKDFVLKGTLYFDFTIRTKRTD